MDLVQHLDKLAALLDRERAAEKERYAQVPLAERLRRGLALSEVEAVEEGGLAGRSLVTFARPDGRELGGQELSAGASVRVLPRRDAPPDDAPTGIVARRQRARIALAFDEPPPDWATGGRVVLELLPSSATWERLSGAVRRMRDAARWQPVVREEPPRFEERPRPGGESPVPLNPEQRAAVELAERAADVMLVHGPPGTGKTTVLVEVIRRAAERKEKVLAAAPSNLAVDNLTERLVLAGIDVVRVGHPARVLESVLEHTLDEKTRSHPQAQIAAELVEQALRLRRTRANATGVAARGGSPSRARRSGRRGSSWRRPASCPTARSFPCWSGPTWSWRRSPESSRARSPGGASSWPSSTRRRRRWSRQPTLPSCGRSAPCWREITCNFRPPCWRGRPGADALALRAAGAGAAAGGAGAGGAAPDERAHHALFLRRALPGQAARAPFGRGSRHRRDAPSNDRHGGARIEESAPEDGDSKLNEGEAGLAASQVRALLGKLLPRELAVISPYEAQVQRLRQLLHDLPELEIDTVDGFQGREKEAVVVSLVRSNPGGELGFLSDIRRINVALTRARKKLIVIGDSATVARHPFYAGFVRYAESIGGWLSAWDVTD